MHDGKDGEFECEDNCFCPPCAAVVAVERGYAPTDTSPEAEGADDQPNWCQRCGRLITLRSTADLEWGITPDGALEELEHFETGLGADRGEPNTPDTWLDFLLLVDSIAEEHLPRVEAVIMRAVGALPGGDGHAWHERDGLPVCSRCGVVRNADKVTLCKGVRPIVETRDKPTPGGEGNGT
jgi:hypothetical protein